MWAFGWVRSAQRAIARSAKRIFAQFDYIRPQPGLRCWKTFGRTAPVFFTGQDCCATRRFFAVRKIRTQTVLAESILTREKAKAGLDGPPKRFPAAQASSAAKSNGVVWLPIGPAITLDASRGGLHLFFHNAPPLCKQKDVNPLLQTNACTTPTLRTRLLLSLPPNPARSHKKRPVSQRALGTAISTLHIVDNLLPKLRTTHQRCTVHLTLKIVSYRALLNSAIHAIDN